MASIPMLAHPDADLISESLPGARRRVRIQPKRSMFISRSSVETSYPDELLAAILEVKGPSSVCDEIARDEDPMYVESTLRRDLFAFFSSDDFRGRRVLDFGCGSGASTSILYRILPGAEIWGVELDERLLRIAHLRAQHYGFPRQRLLLAPDGKTLPDGLDRFDYVLLSAVWEHLLPGERDEVLRQIWSILKPGGSLFLDQTPHRYTPVETHTTGLPFINYLPDGLTLRAARAFSPRVRSDESWESLLRRGIRGGTESEVLGRLGRLGARARLQAPRPGSGLGDRIDLWYASSAQSRLAPVKLGMRALFKTLKVVTGVQMTPSLAIAFEKQS